MIQLDTPKDFNPNAIYFAYRKTDSFCEMFNITISHFNEGHIFYSINTDCYTSCDYRIGHKLIYTSLNTTLRDRPYYLSKLFNIFELKVEEYIHFI